MKKTLIHLASLALIASLAPAIVRRARTHDVAFQYRMSAGFPGDVNRTHPFQVLPGLMDSTDPVRLVGDPYLLTAAGKYRAFKVGDTATKIGGVLVRSYPTQQTIGGMSAAFGTAVPPTSGVVDGLEDGFAMVKCNNFGVSPPVRGGAVFVRIAATAGNLVQGGFHAAADGANTLAITNATWNSSADASGVAEIRVRAA